MRSRTDYWLQGPCRTSLVHESICCDITDQKDESQRGAAETDGHRDTYEQVKVKLAGRLTPGCRSNAIRHWREEISVCLCPAVCVGLNYTAKSIQTPPTRASFLLIPSLVVFSASSISEFLVSHSTFPHLIKDKWSLPSLHEFNVTLK